MVKGQSHWERNVKKRFAHFFVKSDRLQQTNTSK